MVVAASLILLV